MARLPRDRHGSSWDVPLMVVLTLVMVIAVLVVTAKFGRIFHELGVQLPARTQDVLQVWFHVAALVVLAVPCLWRHRAGKESWAVPVWFHLMLLYLVLVATSLFMP